MHHEQKVTMPWDSNPSYSTPKYFFLYEVVVASSRNIVLLRIKKEEWSTVNTQYSNCTRALICKIYRSFVTKLQQKGTMTIPPIFHSVRPEPELKFLTMFISFHYLQARYIQVDTLKLVLNSVSPHFQPLTITAGLVGKLLVHRRASLYPAIGNVQI